jgi:hypothetical protein
MIRMVAGRHEGDEPTGASRQLIDSRRGRPRCLDLPFRPRVAGIHDIN